MIAIDRGLLVGLGHSRVETESVDGLLIQVFADLLDEIELEHGRVGSIDHPFAIGLILLVSGLLDQEILLALRGLVGDMLTGGVDPEFGRMETAGHALLVGARR